MSREGIPSKPAFCLDCGWRGPRMAKPRQEPCPKCKGQQIVRVGDPAAPLTAQLSTDPKMIARHLANHPRLLWQVQRELAPFKPVSAWTPFQGGDYFERIALDGTRAALVHLELGVYHWETQNHSGFATSPDAAMRQADEALVNESPYWRLA